MTPRTLSILAAAFTAAFLAVGWPYWQVPYVQVSLPDTLLAPGLLVVGGACAAAVVARVRALPVFAIVGAAPPAVVLARIVREVALDPTSHNLWPFEVVLAGMLGAAVALAGVALGRVIAKATRRVDKGTGPD
jgi:hypothetical protein